MFNVQRAIFQLYSGQEKKLNATGLETRKGDGYLASATGLLWTTHHEHNAHSELLHWVLKRAKRVAISQHGTSVLFTSHPKDRLVVDLYIIPHNRRMPLQAEEALGPISIPRGSPLLED
jgi:hypothetical protein